MTHPHVRIERRRKAYLWAFSLGMLGWFVYVAMTFKEGDGPDGIVAVMAVWIVGVICLGLYAAYGPLPDLRTVSNPAARVPPTFTNS